jgi:hypothetical protein
MDTQIVAQFRVERGDDDSALPASHRPIAVNGGEHLDLSPDPLDDWRADEHGVDIGPRYAVHGEIGLEGVVLPTEGIAPNVDIDGCEAALIGPTIEDARGQKDHPCAGSECGHALVESRVQRLEQFVEHQELRDCRGLTTGEHECVDEVELGRRADLDRFDPEARQCNGVEVNSPLQRKDSDGR